MASAGHPSSCCLGEASGAPERGPGSALADRRALGPEKEQADVAGGGREGQEEEKSRSKKKNYHRYAKPPYSYLAMIALVIQSSPEKKLKLSQILREISSLFPFFKGDYQGWKDSIRHNLSSNDCFQKVLKDPEKPQCKGNYWTVDVTRIPPGALKLQNTSITRQDQNVFAHDLAPYILHGEQYKSSEAIYHQYVKGSSSSDSEDSGDFTPTEPPKRVPLLPWELPTSYTKCVPPNVVAPPSVNPFVPFAAIPSLPCFSYRPTTYINPTYWGLMPGPATPGQQSLRPPLLMDLDSMLQVTPPNKSVFDVWSSHPGDLLHPVFFSQQAPSSSATLTSYRPI
ncbi:forkhead box protein H1 [Rhinatrema bivittatum]|uniref:forkhead box protein H1 n=1 Tax=Rhinatrema bivittatum TaxID=194408 RepID=UPI00112AF679|nr:forkhead box protein H1 [Rhinatrema bivittatum]